MCRKYPISRSCAIGAFALPVLIAAGCGFFNPDNPPDPFWGIWIGPFPTTVSPEPDSSRWIFTSTRFYVHYALKANGTILARETGYYRTNGYVLTISADPDGKIGEEEFYYRYLPEPDRLIITIRGEDVSYRRIGGHAEADNFEDVWRPKAAQVRRGS